MLICQSQSYNLCPPFYHQVTISLFSISVTLSLFCRKVHSYPFYIDFTYKQQHIIFDFVEIFCSKQQPSTLLVWIIVFWKKLTQSLALWQIDMRVAWVNTSAYYHSFLSILLRDPTTFSNKYRHAMPFSFLDLFWEDGKFPPLQKAETVALYIRAWFTSPSLFFFFHPCLSVVWLWCVWVRISLSLSHLKFVEFLGCD